MTDTQTLEIDIQGSSPEALLRLRNELSNLQTSAYSFAFIPRGGSAFNLDHEHLSLLIAFVQAGGIDFLTFLAELVIRVLSREDRGYFELTFRNGESVRCESNMTEETVRELFQQASRLAPPEDK
mgnify:CR=1 FL=1